jgi:cell shape-determining protein MreD
MRLGFSLFATLVALQLLAGQLNHAISGMHASVYLGGLFVAFAALRLPLLPSLYATFLAGCAVDAGSPLPFGTHAFLFAGAHLFIFNLRDRLPRDETATRTGVALLANLAFFGVLSAMEERSVGGHSAWPRVFCDLIWSQAVLAVIAPWYFAFQDRVLTLIAPVGMRVT